MRDVAELLLLPAPPRMVQIADEDSDERDEALCREKTDATVVGSAACLLVLTCGTEAKAEGTGIIWATMPSLGAASIRALMGVWATMPSLGGGCSFSVDPQYVTRCSRNYPLSSGTDLA